MASITNMNLRVSTTKFCKDHWYPEELEVCLKTAIGLSSPSDDTFDNYFHVGSADLEKGLFSLHFSSNEHAALLSKLEGAKDSDVDPEDVVIILGLRGVIVHVPMFNQPRGANDDLTSGCRVVSRGFGYTPTVTVENLELKNLQILKDGHGNMHHIDFSSSNTYTTVRHEGCVLRVSMHDGAPLVTTNRRINIENSRWGKSDLFLNMYKKYGGPEFSELFAPGTRDSEVTHLFMLCDPDLQIASRYDVGHGYMVYLGHVYNDQTSDTREQVYSAWKDSTLKSVDGYFPVPQPTTEDNCNEWIYVPSKMSLEQVKHALTLGASDLNSSDLVGVDSRLFPGEAVVVSFVDAKTGYHKIIHLNSLAYNWRTAVGGNDPNRNHRFVSLRTYSLEKLPDKVTPKYPDGTPLLEVFNGEQDINYTKSQLIPELGNPSVEELASFSQDLMDSETPEKLVWDVVKGHFANEKHGPLNSDSDFANIALVVLVAFPLSVVKNVSMYYPDFIQQRDSAITYICDNFSKFESIFASVHKGDMRSSYPSLTTFGKEFAEADGKLKASGRVLFRLVTQASAYALKRVQTGNVRTVQNRVISLEALKKDNLRNLMMKEHGDTLYSIINACSRIILFKEEALALPRQKLISDGDFPPLSQHTPPKLPIPRSVAIQKVVIKSDDAPLL